MKKQRDLLLISVDSPILLGIYEDKKLVKSYTQEGKFSDSLPQIFAKVLSFGAESSLDSTPPSPLSLDSFSQKGLHPSPRSPCAPKSSAFSLLGGEPRLSASSKKSAGGTSAPFDSDFLHHEAGEFSGASHEFKLDSANRRINNIFYTNGPGNFSAIKLTHIFLQTLSIVKNIRLFCADAFHFSNNEFINAYGKVHFVKENGEIRTITLDSKRPNSFSLPQSLDLRIFSEVCAPLYILPAV